MKSSSEIKSFSEYLLLKTLITLSGIAVVILGSFIMLIGLNYEGIKIIFTIPSEMPGLLFAHLSGRFHLFSIIALGINPYLSATAIVLLLSGVIPLFKRWRDGDSDQNSLFNKVILSVTVLCAILQSVGISLYINSLRSPVTGEKMVTINPVLFCISTIVILTAGALLSLWVAHIITKHGLFNGIIVFAGFLYIMPIFDSLWNTIVSILNNSSQSSGDIVMVALTVLFASISIWMLKAARYFELVPTKESSPHLAAEGISLWFPLRINYVGIIPIILGTSIFTASSSWGLFKENQYWSWLFYGGVTFFITLLYNALVVSPKNLTENLQKYGYSIKGFLEPATAHQMIDKELMKSSVVMAGFLTLFVGIEMLISKKISQSAESIFSINIIVIVAMIVEIFKRIGEEKTSYQLVLRNRQVLTTVCDCETELEGDMIRNILIRNGIVSYKKSNRAVCLAGSLGIWEICRPAYTCLSIYRSLGAGSIELLVHKQELESAINILQKIDLSHGQAGSPPVHAPG
jgi:preprotein translocase subunit SecY